MSDGLDLKNITDIEVEGVDTKDYPDFCDAFISSAVWDDTGVELTDKEIERLNSDYHDFVYEQVWDSIF